MKCVLALVFCGISLASKAQDDGCELLETKIPACDQMATFTLLPPDGVDLADAVVLHSSGVDPSFNFGLHTAGHNTFTFDNIVFTNYRGYGSFTVQLELTNGTICEIEVKVVECCSTDDYELIFVDETIPVNNYAGEVIWIYGDVVVDPSTSFTNNSFFMATDAQISFSNSSATLFEECSFTKLCEYAWDRILLDASHKEAVFADCSMDNALRGVFCTNDAVLSLEQSFLASNKISLYVEDYTADVISVNGCSFAEIQDAITIVQHPSSPIVMSNYFPTFCAGSPVDQTAPVVVKNSSDVHIGDQAYSTNTFSNNNWWAGDNTFINANNSQVYIRNNTFNITSSSVCAHNGSKIIMGGSAAEANTAYSLVQMHNSSFQLKGNSFETDVKLHSVAYTLPAAGLYTGGELVDNTFTGENELLVDQNGVDSYLRIYDNQFTNYRLTFGDFPAQSNGKLIFHSNTLQNNSYNPQAAVYVNGCHEMSFADNELYGSFPGTPEGTATNMGVWFVETEDVQIANNSIRYFNRGLNLEGDNSGTEVLCNAFLNNYYHIYLDNTLIAANQGSSSNPSGNCFSEIYALPTNPYSGEQLYGTSTQMGTSTWYWYDDPTTSSCADNCHCINPIISTHPLFGYVGEFGTGNQPSCPSIPNKSKLTTADPELKIYPNPLKNVLKIESKRDTRYRIYTMNMKLAKEGWVKAGLNEFNIAELPDGVYLIEVDDRVQRLIRQ